MLAESDVKSLHFLGIFTPFIFPIVVSKRSLSLFVIFLTCDSVQVLRNKNAKT